MSSYAPQFSDGWRGVRRNVARFATSRFARSSRRIRTVQRHWTAQRLLAADRHARFANDVDARVMLDSVKGMGQKELDFLMDDKANTIGALLLHLAATDRIYQLMTFENNPMNGEKDYPVNFKERFAFAMDLGEPARKTIKGHSLDFYTQHLVRSPREDLRRISEARRRMACCSGQDLRRGTTCSNCW